MENFPQTLENSQAFCDDCTFCGCYDSSPGPNFSTGVRIAAR